jgi:hypothetical protein
MGFAAENLVHGLKIAVQKPEIKKPVSFEVDRFLFSV